MNQRLAFAVLAAMTAVTISAGPALAQKAVEDIYPMFFPLIGDYSFPDTFGAPRGGHAHQGIDIMAPKMTPVLAAASGTVTWMHDGTDKTCCALELLHDDGWRSRYIHLNNDTPGTDDGLGWGFADGIEEGVWVPGGSLIGWVGDSGNAESAGSHLHFELHAPDGTVVNPYESLLVALRLAEPLSAEWVPPFRDDEGSVHEADIAALYEIGITTGCGLERYCPHDPVSRSQMAAFLLRMTEPEGSTAAARDPYDFQGLFQDVAEQEWYAEYVERLYGEGITNGCAVEPLRYCPGVSLTRAQMAAFLVRALSLPAAEPAGFADTRDHHFETEIDALAAAGITQGCSDTEFCPDQAVSRDQMASFLIRGLDFESAQASSEG